MTQYHVVTVTWQWHAFLLFFLTVIFLPIFPADFRQYSRTSREPVRVCQTSVRPYTPTGTSALITQNASFVAVSRRNDCVDSAWHSRTCHYDALLFQKIRDRGGNKITGEGEIRRCLHPSNASLRDKPIWPRCWWVIATGGYFSRLAKLASVIQLCLCFPNVSVLDPSVQHRGNIIWGPHTQTKSTFLFDLKAFGVFKAHWLASLGGFY